MACLLEVSTSQTLFKPIRKLFGSLSFVTVTTRHFCPKFSLEVSEVHTTSTHFESRDWWFSIIEYALHGILPDDSKEALPFNEDLLIFIMIRRW